MYGKDGEAEFYVVEFWSDYSGRWSGPGSPLVANVPSEMRHAPGDPHGRDAEPFREWGACGVVWQNTGDNGFYALDDAMEMLRLMARYNPGHRWRVARRRVVRESKTVAEMSWSAMQEADQ